jgi:uncharacterized RDD family membrane protein YckC
MPCPLCGDICRCSTDANSDASPDTSPRWLADAVASPAAGPAVQETPALEVLTVHAAEPSTSSESEANQSVAEDSSAWRQEITARVSRYQARRKPRPPRYPSLRLRFEEEEPTPAIAGHAVDAPAFLQRTTVSNQALALDAFSDCAILPQAQAQGETATPVSAGALPQLAPGAAPPTTPTTAPTTAKIIEFPRSWTPAPPPLDELAEPVVDLDRPRIMEAPEAVPPPPALGGITIEPAQRPETEKRPGIDIPLQSAPLGRRILAAAIDGVIIAAACALFGFIFWKLTAICPPRFQIVGLAAGLASLFWALYQYLLIVYSGTTPGLRLACLELARFDGSRASRRLRRWRVLASFLSAASLGMGYLWVFLDEDALCWHDRITHTYLAPKG